jgi:integrase
MGLTTKRIAKLTTPGRYGDGHGLYLQILSPTNRSWLLRYERNGRGERWMGLGPLHTIDLKKARERARKAREQLLDGIDPLDARRAERAAQALEAARTITFEKAALAYFDAHAGSWRNPKHRAQFLSTLKTYAFPKIGPLPVAAIDVGLVLKCIEPIWHEKTATADRVRGRIASILDWATVRGYRTGDNPARWKGFIENVLPGRSKIQKTVHLPALPFTDIPTFIAELAEREGIAARALEFTILTAARTGEVIGATWDEIDLREKIWTVPAGRIKGGREHRVPLSDRAFELLRALPQEKDNRFVFIGPARAACRIWPWRACCGVWSATT